MRILAVDPGYERLGIAIIERREGKEVVMFSECFKTDKKLPHAQRLDLIGEEIKSVIKKHRPQGLAIESLFFNTNQKTGLLVAEARGVVIYEAARANLKIFEYTPLQIKIAVTGYGRSDKRQVIMMVKKLVVMAKSGAVDDEYDAVATGITCLAHEKF